MTDDAVVRLTEERTALFGFALDAMHWMQRPTEHGRAHLIASARAAADHTGTPERFKAFADWLQQQDIQQQSEDES